MHQSSWTCYLEYFWYKIILIVVVVGAVVVGNVVVVNGEVGGGWPVVGNAKIIVVKYNLKPIEYKQFLRYHVFLTDDRTQYTMSINIFEYGKSAIRGIMYSASFSWVCLRYSRVVVCHLNTQDKKKQYLQHAYWHIYLAQY